MFCEDSDRARRDYPMDRIIKIIHPQTAEEVKAQVVSHGNSGSRGPSIGINYGMDNGEGEREFLYGDTAQAFLYYRERDQWDASLIEASQHQTAGPVVQGAAGHPDMAP